MMDYDTPLTPEEQQAYSAWAQAGGRDPEKEKYDYDLQGYFKSGGSLGEGHLPDTYKKPNHPTFSQDSQYHGKDGAEGGAWVQNPEDSSFAFQPGKSNLENWGPQGLQSYFNKFEPGNTLVIPPEVD